MRVLNCIRGAQKESSEKMCVIFYKRSSLFFSQNSKIFIAVFQTQLLELIVKAGMQLASNLKFEPCFLTSLTMLDLLIQYLITALGISLMKFKI
jgi:hypothetical protein